jgi:glutathione synthase
MNQPAILFVLDPLSSLKPKKDSSIAMMRALHRASVAIWACKPHDLRIQRGEVLANACQLDPVGDDGSWHRNLAAEVLPLCGFSAVLMRKDPPFDHEFLYATHLLSAAKRAGARVFNDPAALRDHNEKLSILEFPEWTAPTLVTSQQRHLLDFLAEHQDIVLKPLDGMGGSGIFRLTSNDPNLGVILETATHHECQTIMAQRYLPQIAQGDKRVLLIDGEPVPFCLARIPKPGESRGNLAAGGKGIAQALSERDKTIAHALGPVLAARGLFLVGLDIIGDHLTEINVTSPTCFVEITQQTGYDVAEHFANTLLRKIAH